MHDKGRAPAGPVAPVREDPAMESLLQEVYSRFSPETSYAVDEIVLVFRPEDIVEACRMAKTDQRLQFNFLRCLSVVEYPEHFQVVYHLYSNVKSHKATLKTNVPTDKPVFPSVVSIWEGANWHEREGAELFGVTFDGHPNPAHLLLYDEFEGYPMLKSYPFAEIEEPQHGN